MKWLLGKEFRLKHDEHGPYPVRSLLLEVVGGPAARDDLLPPPECGGAAAGHGFRADSALRLEPGGFPSTILISLNHV